MPSTPAPSAVAANPVVSSLTPHLFVPTAARPVRAKVRHLVANTQVAPHSHPWAQVAMADRGVVRLAVDGGSFLVPPSHALWIPPGMVHAVTLVDDADLRTLYLFVPRGRWGPHGAPPAQADAWRGARMLEVTPLLRALVREMPTEADGDAVPMPTAERHRERHRERHLSALIRQELARAPLRRLGVDLPRDKRLRQLCEAVLKDPARHDTLQAWALDTGASPRTVARLFRQELATSFTQWRQQVVLAQAVSLAARDLPIAQIAAELGYSPSAFSAMVRRSVGQTASHFLGKGGRPASQAPEPALPHRASRS